LILVQAPYNLRCTFQAEILDATNQAAELLRSLGKDVNNMKWSLQTSLLNRVHSSTERLQRSIDMHSYLLTSSHDQHDRTTKPQLKQSKTLSFNQKDCSSQLADQDTSKTAAVPCELGRDTSIKRQHKRLHSWPSHEVVDSEEEEIVNIIPRMRALESTATLSLATFTSLLIELVARLDHLVEAVDRLATMAKFKQECTV
jgi:Aluminium activated malate transporter